MGFMKNLCLVCSCERKHSCSHKVDKAKTIHFCDSYSSKEYISTTDLTFKDYITIMQKNVQKTVYRQFQLQHTVKY